MHRDEEVDLSTCADCGATIRAEVQEGFSFGTRGVLCFECAARRGGSYDAQQDRWTVDPNLEGLEEGYEGE